MTYVYMFILGFAGGYIFQNHINVGVALICGKLIMREVKYELTIATKDLRIGFLKVKVALLLRINKSDIK